MNKKFSVFFLVFLIMCLSSCNNERVPTSTAVPSPEPVKSPVTTGQKPIVFACIPYESELKLIEAFQALADYISDQTGIPVNLEIKKSYKEIIDGLGNGDIDFANTGPLVYIKAHDKSGANALVKPMPLSSSTPFYKSYIIVRKDSGIKKISQLKGKKFAFTDRESTSGYLLPVLMLADAGVKDLKFFSEVRFTGNHDSAFLAVYNGYVDGAGISNYAFTKAIDKRLGDVIVIAESDAIPTAPITVRANLPSEQVKKIKEAFLNINPDKEETKGVLDIFKIKGYIDASDKDYDSIRRARKAIDKMGLTIVEK
ncbi:MAG: phosphate/phosphite/phosphonate ABC transporter substrate-binding protein [Candidatus Eremiobacterota bacterium]